MRIVPLITACLVAALIFGIVIGRDRLLALLTSISPRVEAAEPAEVVAPEPVASKTSLL